MNRLHGILDTLATRSRRIDSGRVAGSNVTKQSYQDFSINFNFTFPATPNVVVCLESTSTGYGMGMVSVSAINITTTGFTLRVFNADTANRAPAVNWVAIG